jgi:isopropylmalate/homocitrate/citramalate synthase
MFSSPLDTMIIRETAPRDGLEDETALVSTESKVKLIDLSTEAGMSHIEVGSFAFIDGAYLISRRYSCFRRYKTHCRRHIRDPCDGSGFSSARNRLWRE